jgi:hypothetical protein
MSRTRALGEGSQDCTQVRQDIGATSGAQPETRRGAVLSHTLVALATLCRACVRQNLGNAVGLSWSLWRLWGTIERHLAHFA